MPELPEVETVMRGLEPVLKGAVLEKVTQRRPDLRFPFPDGFVENLQGAKITGLSRRAKYILARTDRDQSLLIHLGMSGRMTITSDSDAPFEKHDHVILETDAGVQVRYHDPRRFGFMDLFVTNDEAQHPRLSILGPEPLGNAFNGPDFHASLAKLKSNIKTAIMDQKRVVGVGNIYACESLFKAGINPLTSANSLSLAKIEDLVTSIKSTLKRAIEVGGSSLSDYVQASGELGYFQHEWQVYGREGDACRVCELPIDRIVQAQRSTFYCKSCQSA